MISELPRSQGCEKQASAALADAYFNKLADRANRSARIMFFEFQCPSCLAVLIATNDLVAQTMQCRHCGSSITVPPASNHSLSDRDIILLPALKMLSPKLARTLTLGRGKYWSWARHLDADKLEALLLAIGEFGSRLAATGFSEPEFYPHRMAEDRMRNALKVFGKIATVGRVEVEYGPFRRSTVDDFDLSHHTSAFAMDFQERLATNEQTAWAQGLDEFNLGILLWMVGEYGIRVNCSRGPDGAEYPPPDFEADSYITKPMRAALRLIAKIEGGEAITMTEAKRRIAEDDG